MGVGGVLIRLIRTDQFATVKTKCLPFNLTHLILFRCNRDLSGCLQEFSLSTRQEPLLINLLPFE